MSVHDFREVLDKHISMPSLAAGVPFGMVATLLTDMKVIGLMLMEDHWRGNTSSWLAWNAVVAWQLPGPWLQMMVTLRWTARTCLKQDISVNFLGTGAPQMTWRYTKLSLLVAHVEAHIGDRTVPCLLGAIEDFARSVSNQWLKIAGGDKGSVLSAVSSGCALSSWCGRRPSQCADVRVEFGAFVGYSSARLSEHGNVVSIEHDPVHVRVAQHILDLVTKPRLVEVWLGRVSDLTPRLVEVHGAGAVSMAFLDESGSTFNADLSQLEAGVLLVPAARIAADNCLRPGAPEFLHHRSSATLRKSVALLTNWSLPEFLEEAEGVEDWLAVIL